MANIIREVAETFSTLAQGFSVTFRNMFRKTVTENYPYEPVHFQPRYRGIHVLHRDEGGLEKCVGCFLCAAACPANCIYIEAAENTDANRISAGERYASVYNIDYSRCIFCGYWVGAMREMAGCGDGVARWVGRVAGGVVARLEGLRRGTGPGTPLGDPCDLELLAESGWKVGG